jgi:hypothetical protein
MGSVRHAAGMDDDFSGRVALWALPVLLGSLLVAAWLKAQLRRRLGRYVPPLPALLPDLISALAAIAVFILAASLVSDLIHAL